MDMRERLPCFLDWLFMLQMKKICLIVRGGGGLPIAITVINGIQKYIDSFPLEFVKLFANSIFLDNHMYAKASDLKNEAWTEILFSIFLISIFIYTLNSTTTKCYAWMI